MRAEPVFLEVRGLVSGYQQGVVLHGVDLGVERGGVLGLLGRNGVGKTTLVSTIMGLIRPSRGSVRLDGVELAGRRPDQVARAGVGLVPQGRRVWAPLTVAEHLDLAVHQGRRRTSWDRARVLELLPRLGERLGQAAGLLSGGEQQMLAIARALLTGPQLLLLDEPSDGLAPSIIDAVADVLRTITAEGVTVLLVEQDLHLAFAVSDEIAVLEKGVVVHRAATADFRRDPATARRLLGIA